jgi:hypothetical protein
MAWTTLAIAIFTRGTHHLNNEGTNPPFKQKAKKNKNNDNKAPRCPLNAYNILSAIQRNEIIRKQQEAEEAGTGQVSSSSEVPRAHVGFANLAQIVSKNGRKLIQHSRKN